MQHQLQAQPAGFHREIPQEKAPPRRRPGAARERDPPGRPGDGRWAGLESARPPFTLVSGTPPLSRAGDPAQGPELVTHPSLAKSGRGWAGGGEGK